MLRDERDFIVLEVMIAVLALAMLALAVAASNAWIITRLVQ